MVTFCILVAPLPYTVRKRLFRFLAESAIVAKVAYALKISFMHVVSCLFLSLLLTRRSAVSSAFSSSMPYSACTVLRWNQTSLNQADKGTMCAPRPTSPLGSSSSVISPFTLFRVLTDLSSQRNTYLTGFTLFLSLVLTRTFGIILDLIRAQEEYGKLKNEVNMPISIPSNSSH
jgi:hypothetical protein